MSRLSEWAKRIVADDPTEHASIVAQRRAGPLDEDEYSVSFSIGGFTDIGLAVPGRSVADVSATFRVWLDTVNDSEIGEGDWRTVDAMVDGSHQSITFRGSWVAAFTVFHKTSGSRR